ncbi:F0F1 ATP synthase subunit gamma, partial [Salmonella enterica subsp. enterica serovar Enteritidis]|nr:F0F1 ATP synthase subunit gamma [Salmonella enterica subsp. enterica serovar Enteritidis]
MLDAYNRGEIDEIYMVYNEFVNAMTQNPSVQRLLPIAAESLVDETMENREYSWDYIYEPTTKELLDGLMGRYVESIVYQGVVENIASEQSARMVAMKAATD